MYTYAKYLCMRKYIYLHLCTRQTYSMQEGRRVHDVYVRIYMYICTYVHTHIYIIHICIYTCFYMYSTICVHADICGVGRHARGAPSGRYIYVYVCVIYIYDERVYYANMHFSRVLRVGCTYVCLYLIKSCQDGRRLHCVYVRI